MIKKIFLTFFMLITLFSSICFANPQVTINNITKKELSDFVVKTVLRLYPNAMIENTHEYGLTFLMTNQVSWGLFGQNTSTVENRIAVTFVEQNKNIIASVSETATLIEYGLRKVYPVEATQEQLIVMQYVKGYFNGMYAFGAQYNTKKKNGGFQIVNIQKDSAFHKAGIMPGDIVIAINGNKVKSMIFDSTYQTTMRFTIKRGDQEKVYIITPEYIPPKSSFFAEVFI